MTGEAFRELALALHDAVEGAHMGHPDFRTSGRIFASLDAAERHGMVKVSPEEQRELLRAHPAAFSLAAGAWGRQGCTTVHLEAAREAIVRGALLLAWEHARAKPARRRPPVRSARTSPSSTRKA